MSLDRVRNKASERFNEVQIFLSFIQRSEPEGYIDLVPLELKVMKGLFLVHLYAAFEKTINETVETSLSLISSRNIKNNHFYSSLLSVVLSDKMKSIKDGSYSNIFIKSSELFIESTSNNVIPINETIFSGQLQNVWAKTIVEISSILGMKGFSFDSRARATIDEIVDKRNAVAHGRDNASSVGERYRVNALREKMETISTAAHFFISSVEDHCEQKKYIKPTHRRYYE